MHKETHLRSVAKAASWRTVGSLTTAAIVFGIARKWELAMAAGGIDAFAKLAIFYGHERAWERISFGKRPLQPSVLWLTGLSGAGKTTIAHALMKELERRKIPAEHLDGDTIRSLFPDTGFSRKEREEHIRRVGYLASRLEKNGLFVVVSLISPYESSRAFARSVCKNFVEVHVSTPLEECERRDVKGLYKRARAGELSEFTGISAPYEAPSRPEIAIDTTQVGVEVATARILASLKGRL